MTGRRAPDKREPRTTPSATTADSRRAKVICRFAGALRCARASAAAEPASVSRATAYRYFPRNDAVALPATMSLADDPLGDADRGPPPGEPGAQAADLVATAAWAFDHETELGTILPPLASTDEQPRRGLTNHQRWISALLEGLPADVPPAARDRLAAALIPLFGSDAVVWTTDMAQLPATRPSNCLCGWRKPSSLPPFTAGGTPKTTTAISDRRQLTTASKTAKPAPCMRTAAVVRPPERGADGSRYHARPSTDPGRGMRPIAEPSPEHAITPVQVSKQANRYIKIVLCFAQLLPALGWLRVGAVPAGMRGAYRPHPGSSLAPASSRFESPRAQ